MSALVTSIVIFVLVVTSFIVGFTFCMWGFSMKIREIETKEHLHNGMKWLKLLEWKNS